MSLVRPIINSIPAFDATEDFTITFTATGGDVVTGNELKIITNDATPVTVYDNTVTSSALQHTIPANTLTNGVYYTATVRTYNAQSESSEWSLSIGFYCFTTPTLEFNITDGSTVTTDIAEVSLTYNQIENEPMSYAVINLYNGSGTILIESSGKIYEGDIPPVVTNYNFNIDNNMSYTLVGTVVTNYGTTITTTVHFNVSYSAHTGDYFYAITDNCEGNIKIKSEGIVTYSTTLTPTARGIATGTSSDFVQYDNNGYWANLISLNGIDPYESTSDSSYSNVSWSNIEIPDNFLLGISVIPALIDSEVARITNTYSGFNKYISISVNRGQAQDFITISTDNGTHIDKALGTFCDGHTRVDIYLRLIDGVLSCDTAISRTNLSDPILNWNDNTNNNMYYSITTDILYRDENGGIYVPQSPTINNISYPTYLSNITIGNGLFKNVVLSVNPYESNLSAFSDNPSNILYWYSDNADWGNYANNNFSKVTLERGLVSDDTSVITITDWQTIGTVSLIADTVNYVIFNDIYLPSGRVAYKVKIYNSSNAVAYETTFFFTVKWEHVFISDVNQSFKLQSGVIYSNHIQNIQNNILMPIGATYPIVIQNANGNYRSGALQFNVLGYEFDRTNRLDRISMTKELNDILTFLTNTKPKVIKDFNGNIYVCRIVNSPQVSYDANWGNSIPKVSCDWVEQAQYNDIEAMRKLGFYS